MLLHTGRFVLRDFAESDRAAFVSYQKDPRYRRLYGLESHGSPPIDELFSRFLAWRSEEPRRNLQLAIFEEVGSALCGCAGLRRENELERRAVFGIELAPDHWGRYRLAIEVVDALLRHGFRDLGLDVIRGSTASGNRRVERLARWYGARIVASRQGPAWMTAKGWSEVDWTLDRQAWDRHVSGSLSGRRKRTSGDARTSAA